MQHIIQTLDMFAERIDAASSRLCYLSDRLVGAQAIGPAETRNTKSDIPPVMYQIGMSLDRERDLLDNLFREINRLEEALQMNFEQAEVAPAKGYAAATRLGGGLL